MLKNRPAVVRRFNTSLTVVAALGVTCGGVANTLCSHAAANDETYTLANARVARVLTTADGHLATARIENRLSGTTLIPTACPEFRLRLSADVNSADEDVTLIASDFEVTGAQRLDTDGARELTFALRNARYGLHAEVRYVLTPDDFWMRKYITLTAEKPITLERIDVEALTVSDAVQPYTVDCIYARGKWSPGLGQPLYTSKSGTFWGVEFPAAYNKVRDGALSAGYLSGRTLRPGHPYESHAGVVGVADDPAFVADAFQDYINRIRVRPLRLQLQYNSWFDYGHGVSKESFTASVAKIHHELVDARGGRPLGVYVIDDGWQDTGADWSQKVWRVNGKFDPDFATSRGAAEAAGGHLGLWLSPGCLFGAGGQVPKLRAAGYEALDNWMSMAGPRYMQKLEDRMIELARTGVAFFKLDGIFGHLNTRNFELHGERYGLPSMPRLGLDGLTSGDARLNDAKYDELKLYYLSAGTERLMELFTHLAQARPDIYIVISNGAYLSPWWLMYADSVWMINAGDAAGGSSRTQELVYRDGRYYTIFHDENTQFPLCALFNHEPKKTSSGEPQDVFRRYLYMSLSRGTGFIELYIKPFKLQPWDWDVLAEGLTWAETIFPTFPRVRMHGGNPSKGEVYGYTGWTRDQGYASFHNPSPDERQYTFTLDRAFGLIPNSGPFLVSSPLAGATNGLPRSAAFGDTLAVSLAPEEIRTLNFDVAPRDWSRIAALQQRTPEPERKPVSIDHAVLGTWTYRHAGADYSRTFTKDGWCVLREGDHAIWKRRFEVVDAHRVTVDGGLSHELQTDGTLRIEGHYTAERK